jgi:ABC-type multidrug transport system permease subunit
MLSTFQLTVEIVAGLFFLVVAISCLLWPDKFYEHALRHHYRKADLSEETGQNLQRTGYVWTVRIMGLIAAIMFFFIVIHVLSS